MNATIYGRGQMVIPARARKQAGIDKGDVVSVEPEGDGRILLVRLDRPKDSARAKAKLIHRKGRHALLCGRGKITGEQVQALLADFP